MRTQERFYDVFKELTWFVKFHNKPVWLVPTEDDYKLSVIKPVASELPRGTTAIYYNSELTSIDSVKSSKQI